MVEHSAGLLVWRRGADLEVLLAHPGGPFWARKDQGAWTIPKGLIGEAEAPLAAARREFLEETGLAVEGPFTPLTPVKQRSGKIIQAFAVEADLDLSQFVSNLFELEWPKGTGLRSFPEIDRVAYFDLAPARTRILPGQRPMLDELALKLDVRPSSNER